MKIRHKITLWITGAGIVTSLLFSMVVFVELVDHLSEMVDVELKETASTLADLIQKQSPGSAAKPISLPDFSESHYWIKISDSNQHLVYESKLAKLVDLPSEGEGAAYAVTTHLPKAVVNLGQNRRGEVTFRVRIFNLTAGGKDFRVQAAKPVARLDEEVAELIRALIIGFVASTVLLVGIGYVVAGRILKPIGTINSLAKEIGEKTLDKRIPPGSSRDELYVLSSSLNRMFDRLQYSFQRQKQFIADASHELKTPLASLRLFFEEAVHRSDLPESFKRTMANQSQVLLRMNRLVKGLLDLSALELKGAIETDQVEITLLVNEILVEMTPLIEARRLTIDNRLCEHVHLCADKGKMRRLFINLLDNAIKYNEDMGEIRLESVEKEDSIAFSILNTGAPVPAEELEKVFEQFYRVEKSRSNKFGGAGLGLSIVRQIVTLHGGRVFMKNEPGPLTRVKVILPKGLSGKP